MKNIERGWKTFMRSRRSRTSTNQTAAGLGLCVSLHSRPWLSSMATAWLGEFCCPLLLITSTKPEPKLVGTRYMTTCSTVCSGYGNNTSKVIGHWFYSDSQEFHYINYRIARYRVFEIVTYENGFSKVFKFWPLAINGFEFENQRVLHKS